MLDGDEFLVVSSARAIHFPKFNARRILAMHNAAFIIHHALILIVTARLA
jgi:hypothetical protein